MNIKIKHIKISQLPKNLIIQIGDGTSNCSTSESERLQHIINDIELPCDKISISFASENKTEIPYEEVESQQIEDVVKAINMISNEYLIVICLSLPSINELSNAFNYIVEHKKNDHGIMLFSLHNMKFMNGNE